MEPKCKQHPRYTGKYVPRRPCHKCWKIFKTVSSEKAVEILNHFDFDPEPWRK